VHLPFDTRDQQEQAEILHNVPLRDLIRRLRDENESLKRQLREAQARSTISATASGTSTTSPSAGVGRVAESTTKGSSPELQMLESTRRVTRSSVAKPPSHSALATSSGPGAVNGKVAHLPMEILCRILQYALTSELPIIDPLSKATAAHQTVPENNNRRQLAYHALQACHSFYAEGSRVLWAGQNHFVFTSPQALRNFSECKWRSHIKRVTLRVIARFYDDTKRRHVLGQDYHHHIKRNTILPVKRLPRDQNSMSRAGFRCYTWMQITDFLNALRPPYNSPRDKKGGIPAKLLPSLESLRLDLVNFPPDLLPAPDFEFHDMVHHEFGSTLNELMITGLPCDTNGRRAGEELMCMIKDEGLLLDALPAFVQTNSHGLKPLRASGLSYRLLRTWKRLSREDNAAVSHPPHAMHGHAGVDLPPAPPEIGHPIREHKSRKVLWRKVPVSIDSWEREWKEFDRMSGVPVEEIEDIYDDASDVSEEPGFPICIKCGEIHEEDDDFF
jgi:hypothetical protein